MKKRIIASNELLKDIAPTPLPWQNFENEVALYFEQAVLEGNLAISPKWTKVQRRPKYHSADRRADITFDLSIEMFSPVKTDSRSWLWIVECKDYPNTRVTVDEVEELRDKLRQVGANKGTIATRLGFQKSAIALAKASSIGLMTLESGKVVTIRAAAVPMPCRDTNIFAPYVVSSEGVETMKNPLQGPTLEDLIADAILEGANGT